jgi:glycosyltransferase involved in cell wall biosynthesis
VKGDDAAARVLHVTAAPLTASRFVLPLMRALAQAGIEVELATGPGRGLEDLQVTGFDVTCVPISRRPFSWRNLHALGALRGMLRSGRYDLVHVHTPAAATLTRLVAGADRPRLFYTMHGSFWGDGIGPTAQRLFTGIERRLGRRTDLIFTVNRDDAADCVRLAGVPADRVRTLPAGGAGVDPDLFRADAEVERLGGATRDALRIAPDAPVVAYVGRTAAAKGMGVLAAAFRSIAVREPTCRLLVVGGPLAGDREAYTEERLRAELGEDMAERLIWLGFQEKIAPYLAAADLVVLPSLREGFGMAVAEAAAMGRPAVATDTRGGRAVIEHGSTGLLVPLGDHTLLATSVLRLLRDGALAARLGAAARERARASFTREAVLGAYLAEYEAALGAGRPAGGAKRETDGA